MMFCLMLVTWTFQTAVATTGHQLNTSYILTEYTLMCGYDNLCNPEAVFKLISPLITTMPTGYSRLMGCPKCNCDMDCIYRDDCCPDVVFPYPDMSCESIGLSPDDTSITVLMVSSCPRGTSDELITACSGEYSNAERISQGPVSLISQPVVFRNRFCAKCHGMEENVTKWNFKMLCENLVEINFLNTYDDIFNTAQHNMCSLTYEPDKVHGYLSCSTLLLNNDFVNQCNVTGYWTEPDPNIEWACHNYRQPYRVFANIFCFICNPNKPADDNRALISACNTTGMWRPYDHDLEDACLGHPSSEVATPFKNKFCYLCNRRTDTYSLFLDSETRVISEVFQNNVYEVILEISDLHSDKIDNIYVPKNVTVSPNIKSPHVNTSKLLFLYFLHFGYHGNCITVENSSVFTGPICSCDLSCVTSSTCCAEFALTGPVTFANEYQYSLSVSKCYNNFYNIGLDLEEKCETTEYLHGIDGIPVRSKTTGILYRNFYCFLCNEVYGTLHSQPVPLTLEYDPLDLEINCSFVLQMDTYLYLDKMLKHFREMNVDRKYQYCQARTVNDMNRDDLKVIPSFIKTCNVTGDWDAFDPDVEWACINYYPEITEYFLHDSNKVYKNIFCKICNTASESDVKYQSCNVTGLLEIPNDTINHACLSYPRVASQTPYKNVFCEQCNPSPPGTFIAHTNNLDSGCISRFGNNGDKGVEKIVFANTLRTLLSVTATPDTTDVIEQVSLAQHNVCMKNEVYDKEKRLCKLMTCADGKKLKSGKCVALLEMTTSLRYTMALKLSGSIHLTENITAKEIILEFKFGFSSFLMSAMQLPYGSLDFVSLHILLYESCTEVVQAGEPRNITIYSHVSFVIQSTINRIETENKLVNISNGYIRFSTYLVDFEMVTEPSYYALEFPGVFLLLDRDSVCFQSKQSNSLNRISLVSRLLVCPRVLIDKDRYDRNEHTHNLTLNPGAPVLSFVNYLLLSNKSVIICLDDFIAMMESEHNLIEKDTLVLVVGLVSFLCACLSMLSLILTFLTYCFFAELRSIPGKNNMCLIVALFFAQGLTQFGISQTQSKTWCVVIGICLHFFWLATFFSMNVCSFHMFRVFAFPMTQMQSSHKWTCFCYIIYIYGMSAAIIITYISVAAIMFDSEDMGYSGNGKCFVSSFEALIVSFISPVVVMCMSNLIFFAVTAYKISIVPKIPSNQSARREFLIYIKMFVLTGATWIFQIIDSFVPLSAFSVIVAILNGSQGIFIFISYSMNSRVRQFYRNQLSRTLTSDLSKNDHQVECEVKNRLDEGEAMDGPISRV